MGEVAAETQIVLCQRECRNYSSLKFVIPDDTMRSRNTIVLCQSLCLFNFIRDSTTVENMHIWLDARSGNAKGSSF